MFNDTPAVAYAFPPLTLIPPGQMPSAALESAATGDGVGLSSAPGAPAAVGLTPERLNLSRHR